MSANKMGVNCSFGESQQQQVCACACACACVCVRECVCCCCCCCCCQAREKDAGRQGRGSRRRGEQQLANNFWTGSKATALVPLPSPNESTCRLGVVGGGAASVARDGTVCQGGVQRTDRCQWDCCTCDFTKVGWLVDDRNGGWVKLREGGGGGGCGRTGFFFPGRFKRQDSKFKKRTGV
jgi:hypothetical protein